MFVSWGSLVTIYHPFYVGSDSDFRACASLKVKYRNISGSPLSTPLPESVGFSLIKPSSPTQKAAQPAATHERKRTSSLFYVNIRLSPILTDVRETGRRGRTRDRPTDKCRTVGVAATAPLYPGW